MESSKVDDCEEKHGGGVCAICLDEIVLQETALVKGCEHAYWFVSLSHSFACCFLFFNFLTTALLLAALLIYVLLVVGLPLFY